jgi:hypothetical protein
MSAPIRPVALFGVTVSTADSSEDSLSSPDDLVALVPNTQ